MDEEKELTQTHNAQIHFPTILLGVRNYESIQTAISKTIAAMRVGGTKRFGFVSGRMGNGSETNPALRLQSIKDDMIMMRKYTEQLQKKYRIPIFSSVDIFNTVWEKLEETSLPQSERSAKMKALFRAILKSGITDIYMMKNWEEAPGSIDEREISEQIGLTIHNPEPIELADGEN